MKRGVVAVNWLASLFAVIVIAGCSDHGNPSQSSPEGRTDSAYLRLFSPGIAESDVLRVREDGQRNRLWVLTLEHVRVFDTAATGKTLIRQMALPNWSVAPFDRACRFDLALDRSGSAFISSNAQPRLWRIDADSFETTEHEIVLREKEHWDVGFGALGFAADGTLYAVTSVLGSLWKVDLAAASARLIHIDQPPVTACAFTAQFLKFFERSPKPWTRPSAHHD